MVTGTRRAVTTGTVKPCAVRMRRRTPTSVSSMCAGACGSELAIALANAYCVSERRKPQIKHAITNKDVEFHGNNDINVVIIATGDVFHADLDCSLVDPFTHFSIYPNEYSMTKLALFVRLEAKPGQEAALADFLASALPLANAESGTTAWFALKFGPSTFGVFDAFADEAGRQAHLNGQIAAALMANAATLLSSPPNIEKVELLAAKLPA